MFPHLTVLGNTLFGIECGRAPLAGRLFGAARRAALAEAEEMLAAVGLEDSLHLYPAQMSGGMQQRLAIAQALIKRPRILLLDEPFGALDPITRDALGDRVRALHAEFGLTTVMVTHDMAEALLLADRVLVMDAGTVVADETPHSLLAGAGGEIAQGLVAVPRAQADRLAELAR